MQRVLDPAQIEAFGQRSIPRLRLPDATVFARRATRLRELSKGHALGDYLRLMAELCEAQERTLAQLPPAGEWRYDARAQLAREHGMPLLQAVGWPRTSVWRTVLAELCTAIEAAADFPAAVGDTCRRIRSLPAAQLETQADLLLAAAAEGIDAQAAPFLMASLQVYWMHLVRSLPAAALAGPVVNIDVPEICPVCGTLPVASIVRADQAHQGYRYLHCALCSSEWHMVRIKCSQCLSTEGIHLHAIRGGPAAIRAEGCESCRCYRKICYQEQDPGVEPVADDLASLALDLLMTEAGFNRASGHPLLW